ncbi:Gfo/Idh/MocA family oxidoreductase [Agromyces protaetiae]|uniref:Gfo/Idh/MocA family oxidoreductase n=1 Tax=Agromyces protaetiae TaxID=2509455 RepID=A0A4V0YH46_9MICO|nr:Gfo/Idh/MocA family oxidoreductase [Agromyces protaetiae]QAY73441.1 Gfo/Idh/MocA family oxidoreductase [Agromyces protaetiae]
MSGPLGIGVIGAGTISNQYLRNMTAFPDLNVVIVGDLFEDKAAEQAAAYGVAESGSPEAVLNHPGVDLVVNLTIPQAHAEVSSAALAAGKHVFSEKPFATSREEGLALLAQADAAGLRVGGAPDTFLGAGLQTARRIIERGDIGTPLTGLTLFEVPGPVDDHRNLEVLLSRGAGPLWDMGPYYLTALSQVFGSFSSVVASARTARPQRTLLVGPKAGQVHDVQVPTHVSVLADFAGGGESVTTLSWDSPHRRVGHVEIVGTEATLSIPDPNEFDGTLRIKRKGNEQWTDVPATGAVGGRGLGPLDIARSIAAGVPHRASGLLAYHVLDTMASVTESIERHEWVDVASEVPATPPIPEDWDPYAATL